MIASAAGRSITRSSGGHVVEGGGQYVGPGQDRILALAKSLGIATFPTYQEGKLVLSLAGLRLARPAYEADSADLKRVKRLLESLAATVPTDAPWAAEHAREWDDETVAGWLAKNTRDVATKLFFDVSISTELGPPSSISLLYYLFIIRSAGSIHALEVDAQERRFVGGPQSLSKGLAAPLADRLVLDSPVLRIVDDEKTGVEVESKRAQGPGPARGGRDDARGHATNRLHARIAAGAARPRGGMAR